MIILLAILVGIILLIVVGSAVVGLALNLLWWALIGVVIGALARLVLPGRQTIGLLATAAAGVGGALLGGIIADAVGVGSVLQFVIAVAVATGLVALLGGTERARA